MARRGKKSDGAIVLLVIIAFIMIIIKEIILLLWKLILAIWPLILIGIILYFYLKWQSKKLDLYGNNWKKFYRNELKKKIKIAVIIIPISIAIGNNLYSNYQKEERIRIEREEREVKKIRDDKKRIQLILQAKKDSSQVYLDLALKDLKRKRYKGASANLDSSLKIYPENHKAHFIKATTLRKRRKYNNAINTFNELSNKTSQYKSEIFLEKGKCLLGLGEKRNAILQIHQSAKLGNIEAGKLYEKANPFIREIIGYVTRCCDGTTSSAKGRGACSHHGGVCNWNDPIYRKRRKYQVE